MLPEQSQAKKVLIVDDDAEMRSLLWELFLAYGLEVVEAANGLEALLVVKRWRPDIVVLDIRMPRVDGLDALKRMMAFDPGLHVVVITGSVDVHVRRQALTLGAAAALTKPLDLPSLLAALSLSAPSPVEPVADGESFPTPTSGSDR